MKRFALAIAALVICGCGDDVEKNYYITQSTEGGFPNISTAAPQPDPSTPEVVDPPVIAGARPWIPSNTFCTSAMNAAFTLYSTPESISSTQTNYGFNSSIWSYPVKGMFVDFSWGTSLDPGACSQVTSTYLEP